jgi:DNA-binding NarL/FixJ family response regulator
MGESYWLAIAVERTIEHAQAAIKEHNRMLNRDHAIRNAHDDGCSVRQIAKAVNLSPSNVGRIVRPAHREDRA